MCSSDLTAGCFHKTPRALMQKMLRRRVMHRSRSSDRNSTALIRYALILKQYAAATLGSKIKGTDLKKPRSPWIHPIHDTRPRFIETKGYAKSNRGHPYLIRRSGFISSRSNPSRLLWDQRPRQLTSRLDQSRAPRSNGHHALSLHDGEHKGVVGPHGGGHASDGCSAPPTGKSNAERC